MRRTIRILVSLIVVLALSTTTAGRFRTCNDNPVILEGDPTTRISTISFPRNTTQRSDLNNSLEHWNDLLGMWLEFSPLRDFSGSYAFDNDRNEIVFQDISALGRATLVFDACFWWFESQHIQEFDIEIDSNTSWLFGAPNEVSNDGNNSIRYTMVHELGHALGLLHTNGSNAMSVMKQSSKGQSWHGGHPASRVHPHPDDTFTSRFLYPFSNTHRDIAASPFEVLTTNQNATESMANTTVTVANGRTFPVRASFGNLGNVNENFQIVFVLSTNQVISVFDNVVASGTGTAPSGSFHSFTWTARVPNNLAPGVYSLGMILDPNDRIAERIEGNNLTRLRTRVRVP